jgi:hypothetical protein
MNPRTDGTRDKLFLQQQLAGNDDVCIDCPQRHAQLARGFDSPVFRLPHGVFIADHNGRPDLRAEFQQTVFRIGPQDETDSARRQLVCNVRDSFRQKTVVP